MGIADYLRQPEEPHLEVPSGLSLSDIFEEEPVRLDVFIGDQAYLSNPPLSPVQFVAVQHIERIFNPIHYALMAEEFGEPYWAEQIPMRNIFTFQWGKGSGKDHICRVASLRIAYLVMCLWSPQRYFRIPEQDTITLLNIASSTDQAERAFFKPMTRVVRRGWFKDRAQPTKQTIVYDKNVEAVSGSSDSDTQEGGNLLLGVADEVDAFRTRAEIERYRGTAPRESPKSAEAILKMLRTSGSTRFRTYKTVRISYPRYKGSTIQRLTEQARKDVAANPATSQHYVSGPLATWQVNPNVSGPEVFAEDYKEDRAMAEAMYECNPSAAIDSYFRNMEAVRQGMSGEQPVAVDYVLRVVRSEVTHQAVTMWEPVFQIDPAFQPIAGAAYAIHADMAVRGDRAGVAMSHVSRWDSVKELVQDEDGAMQEKTVQVPVLRTDFCINFSSDLVLQPAREIQIRWARQLCFELINRGFSVQSFTFDGFQSVDSMQILESHGIATKKVSTDRDDGIWKTLRDVVYDGRWSGPFSEVAVTEIESLGRINGRVDHPAGGSKDEADALACSVAMAIGLGGEEDPDGVVAIAVGDQDFSTGGYVEGFADVGPEVAYEMPEGFDGRRPMYDFEAMSAGGDW